MSPPLLERVGTHGYPDTRGCELPFSKVEDQRARWFPFLTGLSRKLSADADGLGMSWAIEEIDVIDVDDCPTHT